jgi:DNA topoisomerase-2
MAVAGLAVVGRQKYGVFPLRGKLMNVCDVSADKIAANEEISNLKKILGLQSGRTYTSTADLRYGRIMAMTDQDTDGTHIRGLLFNLFLRQWPSLLKLDGFMTAMLTPIVKAVHVRTKEELAFYNISDFEAWRSANAEAGGWRTKYYKGLGTSTPAEAREYFKKMRIVAYRWDDATSADALGLSFDKKRADDRKAWLQTYRAEQTLDYGKDDVSYREFVDLDLKHFSNYDVLRSIPSAIDGLKVSQRKALFGCFKRNLKDEVKVAQLAAYVSEHSAFHHGEASMQGTIIGLAQDFVGSNNVNVLQPVGQFGSRLAGGSDHASPRYIHTHLTPVARALYVAVDDVVLKRAVDDDNNPVEPKHYVPVLPMVLINGAAGIGTGYSTNVPCHNPHDVAASLRALIDSVNPMTEPLPDLKPWFRGFTGAIEADGDKLRLRSRGILKRTGNLELTVSELPLGMWTEDFKEALEAFIEKRPEAKGYVNRSTDATVCFIVTFSNKDALDGLLAQEPSGSGLTKLEMELKMTGNRSLLSTSNMHLFNGDGQIRKYDTVNDIMRDFFSVRLAAYEARKAAQLEAMCHDALVLEQKVAFLGLVTGGDLQLHQRDSGNELDAELESHGLARIDGSYKFLLGMAMSSMTRDRKAALEAELVVKRAAIVDLEGRSARQLWNGDIDAVLAAVGAQD